MTLLALDMVEAGLDGRQPRTLTGRSYGGFSGGMGVAGGRSRFCERNGNPAAVNVL